MVSVHARKKERKEKSGEILVDHKLCRQRQYHVYTMKRRDGLTLS